MPDVTRRRTNTPALHYSKTVRQYLQEVTNAGIIHTAEQGFRVIDQQAARMKTELKRIGISNADEMMDDLTGRIKRKAADLMTGRPAR
jgi:hypothetical protein